MRHPRRRAVVRRGPRGSATTACRSSCGRTAGGATSTWCRPWPRRCRTTCSSCCLMLDAARGASATTVTAVIPHFAYARSDKKDAPRIAIGARLVADMLAAAGANRVVTMDLHSPQVHGFFSIPVDHLNAVSALAEHFIGDDLANSVVVSPGLRQRQGGQPAGADPRPPGRRRLQAAAVRRHGGDRPHRRRRRGQGRDRAGRRDRHRRVDRRAAAQAARAGRTPDPVGLHPRPVHRARPSTGSSSRPTSTRS